VSLRDPMTEPEAPEKRPTLFTRLFGATRYVMTVAVLAVFVGATVLLVLGIIEMGSAVLHAISPDQSSGTESVSLRVAVIEAVDVILGPRCQPGCRSRPLAIWRCAWPVWSSPCLASSP
jgi:hypothetical protein